jgi:hypothetical protein
MGDLGLSCIRPRWLRRAGGRPSACGSGKARTASSSTAHSPTPASSPSSSNRRVRRGERPPSVLDYWCPRLDRSDHVLMCPRSLRGAQGRPALVRGAQPGGHAGHPSPLRRVPGDLPDNHDGRTELMMLTETVVSCWCVVAIPCRLGCGASLGRRRLLLVGPGKFTCTYRWSKALTEVQSAGSMCWQEQLRERQSRFDRLALRELYLRPPFAWQVA